MATRVDLSGLMQFSHIVQEDLRGSGRGPVRRALRQWGARYRSFAQERFDKFSKGGGDWAPLKAATIAGRRHGKQKNTLLSGGAAILRDTNVMFLALSPAFTGKPGQLQKDIPFGIRVGYGGPGTYPDGSASVADIAAFHDQGAGNLPKRQIIVMPDTPTAMLMAGDMDRALEKTLKKTEMKNGGK